MKTSSSSSGLKGVVVDSREPAHIQKGDFGAPVAVRPLKAGDVVALTSDGYTLVIERKTPDDFLNSLKDGRLFEQIQKIVWPRYEAQLRGEKPRVLPYLIITGIFKPDRAGKVITDRPTGWSFSSVMGALLSVQEAGAFVGFCNGDADFAPCVRRLAEKKRDETLDILPHRPVEILGPKETVLASLPGIGIERARAALEWGGGNLAVTLIGLTDPEIVSPIPRSVRETIRKLFGLRDNEELGITEK